MATNLKSSAAAGPAAGSNRSDRLATPAAPPVRPQRGALERLLRFFSSLRLTVVCLAFGMIVVFAGTLAQVDLGLYKAQNEFFRSFFIYWQPKGAGFKLPVLPGGYLVGGVLLLNLVAAHFTRLSLTRRKIGLWLTHAGIILLLLGQLLTDMLSCESSMHLREGQAGNYSETEREAELVVIDSSDAELDKVVAIPQGRLHRDALISHAEMPFSIKVHKFLPNSAVEEIKPGASTTPSATQGVGPRVAIHELPRATEMEKRDVPAAVVEIVTPKGSLGTWVVSEFIETPQVFHYENRHYRVAMRPRRYYAPYTLELQKFQHEVYAGTDIPKNFASRVIVHRPDTGEKREVLIYMNSPLRYGGQTYYQSGFDPDDHGTILQVVTNPGWLTPYFACGLVSAGLLIQFTMHLLGFALKRRTT